LRSEMQVLLASPALWASRALMASLGKTASMACRASRARMVLPVLRALQARTARRDRRGRRGRPALLANRAKTAKTVWTARLVAILDPAAAAAAASAPSFDLDPQEPHALDECRPPALLTWSPVSSVSSARHCMGAWAAAACWYCPAGLSAPPELCAAARCMLRGCVACAQSLHALASGGLAKDSRTSALLFGVIGLLFDPGAPGKHGADGTPGKDGALRVATVQLTQSWPNL
jgi:hypothetical protein